LSFTEWLSNLRFTLCRDRLMNGAITSSMLEAAWTRTLTLQVINVSSNLTPDAIFALGAAIPLLVDTPQPSLIASGHRGTYA
jgi:hypothetical protein